MKILVYPDFHGELPSFPKPSFDLALSPGDICTDPARKYSFEKIKKMREGRFSNKEWYDIVGREKAKQLILDSLKGGRKTLEKINSYGKTFIVPGNSDWSKELAIWKKFDWNFIQKDHFSELLKNLDNLTNIHLKSLDIGDYTIIGYGLSSFPEYPQDLKELEIMKKNKPKSLKEMENIWKERFKKLDTLFKKASGNIILLSHNQPYGTQLDKIDFPESPRHGMHAGSIVVKELIEKHQPVLVVGGHFHEHFKSIKIGETTCVCSGLGPTKHVILKLQGSKITDLNFVE